ncbi:MAG: GntR family transcriptional regulator [Trueperaceae bacterium]
MNQGVIKRSFDVQAADILRTRILEGDFGPGHRLTEIALSQDLAVSRGTIRAALHQLSSEGLISLRPYTGWQVSSFGDQDIWEVFTLRASLESLASALVAQRIKSKHENVRDTLVNSFTTFKQLCQKGGKKSRIADADFELHTTIVSLAHHQRLQEQYRYISQQIKLCIASEDDLVGDPKLLLRQHEPLLEALLAGQEDKAEKLAKQHVLESQFFKQLHLKREVK